MSIQPARAHCANTQSGASPLNLAAWPVFDQSWHTRHCSRSIAPDVQKEIQAGLPRGCTVLFDGGGESSQIAQECRCWLLCELIFWIPVGIWACFNG